jgi:hypothetical protein
VNIRMIAVIALSAVTVLVIPCAIGVRAAWTAPAPPPVDAACTRAMNSATVDSVGQSWGAAARNIPAGTTEGFARRHDFRPRYGVGGASGCLSTARTLPE